MRDRYKKIDQHHRLVQSHWDLDDEFINLSIPMKLEENQTSFSSSALIALLLLSLFSAVIIKMSVETMQKFNKKKHQTINRAKRRHQPTDPSTSNRPVKRTKLIANTASTATTAHKKLKPHPSIKLEGEIGYSAPPLIEEAKPARDGNEEIVASSEEVECVSTIVQVPPSQLSLTVKGESLTYKVKNEEDSYVIASNNKRHAIFKEASDLAEKVKVASEIFTEQGLDPKQAHDFVLQRHLSDIQEQSRRDYENHRLAVECQMRSVELEQTERRHRESIMATTQLAMDPNGVPKCLVARNRVLEFATNSLAYLLLALAIDRLCRSGIDTIRSELFCECQNQASWNSMVCAFNPYICAVAPSCWMSCGTRWGSRIALGLGMRFVVGFRLQHVLPLVAGFVLWNQLQLIWYFVMVTLLIALMMYAMIMYRSHVVQGRLKRQLDKKKELVDDYLIECDHVKMGITITLSTLFFAFEWVEQGFLLSMLMFGAVDSRITLR